MKCLFELSPDETKEYVNMINNGELKPVLNQTHLEAYLEYKENKKNNLKEWIK